MSEPNACRPPAQDVTAQDRATQVATDVVLVVVQSLRGWLHGGAVRPVYRQIEARLLDEFEDIAHQARGERGPPTD
jgi:hypothetical protein